MLVRNHNGFTHLPVDRVCDVTSLTSTALAMNWKARFFAFQKTKILILPTMLTESVLPLFLRWAAMLSCVLVESLCQCWFQVPPPENGRIDLLLTVYFTCNDSCVNSQTYNETTKSVCMPHKGRDLRLIHTLEIKRNYKMEILQRCSTFLWIKADISRPHVLKKERRSAVGGLGSEIYLPWSKEM
jgi:hypothetical protein